MRPVRTAITINDCGMRIAEKNIVSFSAIRNRYSAIANAVLLLFCALPCRAEENTAAMHYQSGLAYERLRRLDEAYTELQLASNLDNNNPSIAVALGILAMRL